MHYRIVRLAAVHYQEEITSLFRNNSDYRSFSYLEKLSYYFDSTHLGSLHSDSFSNSMRLLGHEIIDIVCNFELLQKTWAVENKIFYNDKEWAFDILMAQIKHFKPDVVFVQTHTLTRPGKICTIRNDVNIMGILKDQFPFIRLCALFSGFPAHYNRIQHADLLFAGTPSISQYYSDLGADPILLYHGFDENLVERRNFKRNGNKRNQEFNLTFIGSSRAPESRYWALLKLLTETDIELWTTEYETVHRPPKQGMTVPIEKESTIVQKAKYFLRAMLKQQLDKLNKELLILLSNSKFLPYKISQVVSECIQEKSSEKSNEDESEKFKDSEFFNEMKKKYRAERLKLPEKLLREMYPDRCHEPVMGLDMYSILTKSRITFNKHTDYIDNEVGNMRLFETTGVGTCLLTDTGNNMPDLFEEDKEVVTYRTVDEAIEKAKYLIDHEDVREEIGKAGQERTLKDHTVFSRCQLIDEAIQKML